MKRISAALGILCVLSLLSVGVVAADVSKDERNLEREAKRLNDTAAKPDGEKAVVKQLTAEFKATDQQVQALRDRQLGYGEVAIVLAANFWRAKTWDREVLYLIVLVPFVLRLLQLK